jgi:nitrogen fixation/metabolism regulation signal transduction histidine kinase
MLKSACCVILYVVVLIGVSLYLETDSEKDSKKDRLRHHISMLASLVNLTTGALLFYFIASARSRRAIYDYLRRT